MFKWFFLFLFSGIIVLAVTLYFKLGAYKDPTIEIVNNHKELHLIFKKHTGPYHKINTVIAEVEKWAIDNNVPCSETFGEYLDKPGTIADDRLRSNGGCLARQAYSKEHSLPEGYGHKTIPAQNYLKALFTGSPSIGPFIVYPAIEKWMDKKSLKVNGPVIEIYKVTGKDSMDTTYLFPITN